MLLRRVQSVLKEFRYYSIFLELVEQIAFYKNSSERMSEEKNDVKIMMMFAYKTIW